MTKKLSFSIENVAVVKENPNSNFALLSLDFFASGKNLHDLYVSEETLLRTASSIKNCPLVWKYDEKLDDAYTHDKDEVPCGFVPESSIIQTRRTHDNRTMLSVVAYVWKKYTGDLLKFFKRDGKKPVSVEMSVYETKELDNGLVELVDFKYEGITVLGNFVTPAIPLANAKVLSFAKLEDEYKEDFEKEFSEIIDMSIPEDIKNNVKRGLELRKQQGRGSTSIELATAHYLIKSKDISPEKVHLVSDLFSTLERLSYNHSTEDAEYASWMMFGGDEGYTWTQALLSKLDRKKEMEIAHAKELLTFPYKSKADMNPALKGIDPPVSLAQANAIAAQADSIGNDEKKNGWAIAISNFKKTHTVKDGRWVKKESASMSLEDREIQETYLTKDTLRKEEENMGDNIIQNGEQKMDETMQAAEEVKDENCKGMEAAAEEPKKEEMQDEVMAEEEKEKPEEEKEEEMAKEEEPKKEEMESVPADEMAEKTTTQDKVDGEDEKTEEPKKMSDEVKMSVVASTMLDAFKTALPAYRDMNNDYGNKILKVFEDFALEAAKGKFDVAEKTKEVVMCLVNESNAKIAELSANYAKDTAQLAELIAYKTSNEAEKFANEIETVLAEAREAGMPKDNIEQLREESKNFSLETIDEYKNMVKAKAFVFVNTNGTGKQEEEIVKIGLPFVEAKPKSLNIWD